jgi:hypothetical protein
LCSASFLRVNLTGLGFSQTWASGVPLRDFYAMLAFEQRGADHAIDAVEVGDELIGVVTTHDRIT